MRCRHCGQVIRLYAPPPSWIDSNAAGGVFCNTRGVYRYQTHQPDDQPELGDDQ